ncbi:zinc finger protein BALDIBIS-like [Impatiens glandulifera]|uniref:zinc finger protein BALDIBIS-like n=1 Tax=Impatiens glandulifera TaxID=253017 RepID=UPI001FB198CF|nr:zinc finger protein BALDIBIS-like [Impatiens glandulifera]
MSSDRDTLSSILLHHDPSSNPNPNSNPAKRKRNLPGNPDPDAEVIALSPKSLMATNRFLCEICNKGFQRDQNLQLHRRGHNLPWKLKQRNNKEVIRKKVYVCPEKGCVHNDPSRALGDLTGIKKHFSRKHGEKKWKCDKCSKKYAVQSDWKAHSKICGTREYKCDCGTIFSRKDSFITHRAFCDALAEESARFTALPTPNLGFSTDIGTGLSAFQTNNIVGLQSHQKPVLPLWLDNGMTSSYMGLSAINAGMPELIQPVHGSSFGLSPAQPHWSTNLSSSTLPGGGGGMVLKEENINVVDSAPGHMSATALLQKAAQMGSTRSSNSSLFSSSFGLMGSSHQNSKTVENINRHQLMVNQLDHDVGGGGGGFVFGDPGNNNSSVGGGGGGSSGCSSQRRVHVLDPLMMMGGGDKSLTRDFLGVGAGRRLLEQELGKFGSINSNNNGSAMNLAAAAAGHEHFNEDRS